MRAQRGPQASPAVRRPAGHRAALRGEDGRVSILALGLIVVLIGLILTVSSITQVAIAQRKLLGLADGSAAAGLEAFVAVPGEGGGAGRLRLDAPRVREAVEDYLSSVEPDAGLTGVRLDEVRVEADGVTVVVRLSASTKVGPVADLVPSSVDVGGEGRARLGLAP